MTVDLSSTGLAKLQAEHHPIRRDHHIYELCGGCGDQWPCLFSLLLAELVRLRAEHDQLKEQFTEAMRLLGESVDIGLSLLPKPSIAAALVPVQHPTDKDDGDRAG